jgi:hypothetical protein
MVIFGTLRDVSEATLQSAHAGTIVNEAQNSAASPNFKKKESDLPRISARVFMCVPPDCLASLVFLGAGIVA